MRLDSVDSKQYDDLMRFKDSSKSRGLIEEYREIAEFCQKFSRHLAQTVLREFCGEGSAPTGPVHVGHSANEIGLSANAIELLLEAAKDNNGRILRLDSMSNSIISTNNRQFIEQGNMRSTAKWFAAVGELERADLIRDESYEGQVYSVTNAGYEVADVLEKAASPEKPAAPLDSES